MCGEHFSFEDAGSGRVKGHENQQEEHQPAGDPNVLLASKDREERNGKNDHRDDVNQHGVFAPDFVRYPSDRWLQQHKEEEADRHNPSGLRLRKIVGIDQELLHVGGKRVERQGTHGSDTQYDQNRLGVGQQLAQLTGIVFSGIAFTNSFFQSIS